ncbi:hypothetical protein RHMOL_Rhmol01G0117000 [Rhododendron molle]|uniref:Uncharacterized protein n=1 Tax=Rhododendron molle TaxID=49168 RepID=A0ACC0Q1T4_RHOML|nr:hypothetical protein RHMOL_Rhmol01G0117000 [Rhododendron molle]
MVGPAQSMLTNMIPSIGTMKVNSIDTAVEEGKLPEDNKGDRVKKKRVSYKMSQVSFSGMGELPQVNVLNPCTSHQLCIEEFPGL